MRVAIAIGKIMGCFGNSLSERGAYCPVVQYWVCPDCLPLSGGLKNLNGTMREDIGDRPCIYTSTTVHRGCVGL